MLLNSRILCVLTLVLLAGMALPAAAIPFQMEPPRLDMAYERPGRLATGVLRVDFLDGDYDGHTSLIRLDVTIQLAAGSYEPGVDVIFDVPVVDVGSSHVLLQPFILGPNTATLQIGSSFPGHGGIASIELLGLPGTAHFETNLTSRDAHFVSAVPEPSAALLYGIGLVITSASLRRRRARR